MGMTKREFKRLLRLPVDERLELATRLRDSVRHDEEVRFVPIGSQEAELVTEYLEALGLLAGEGERCEVIEA